MVKATHELLHTPFHVGTKVPESRSIWVHCCPISAESNTSTWVSFPRFFCFGNFELLL